MVTASGTASTEAAQCRLQDAFSQRRARTAPERSVASILGQKTAGDVKTTVRA